MKYLLALLFVVGCSSLTNDKIRVTLEGELTFNEALAKHRGEK